MTVLFGMTILSALKLKPLVSFPRFIAGGRGDFDFGEIGGVNKALVLGLVAEIGGGGGGQDAGATFFTAVRLSRVGTRLQVG